MGTGPRACQGEELLPSIGHSDPCSQADFRGTKRLKATGGKRCACAPEPPPPSQEGARWAGKDLGAGCARLRSGEPGPGTRACHWVTKSNPYRLHHPDPPSTPELSAGLLSGVRERAEGTGVSQSCSVATRRAQAEPRTTLGAPVPWASAAAGARLRTAPDCAQSAHLREPLLAGSEMEGDGSPSHGASSEGSEGRSWRLGSGEPRPPSKGRASKKWEQTGEIYEAEGMRKRSPDSCRSRQHPHFGSSTSGPRRAPEPGRNPAGAGAGAGPQAAWADHHPLPSLLLQEALPDFYPGPVLALPGL